MHEAMGTIECGSSGLELSAQPVRTRVYIGMVLEHASQVQTCLGHLVVYALIFGRVVAVEFDEYNLQPQRSEICETRDTRLTRC